jgi:Carboxypeptidase regulatory-like domain
MAAVRTLLALVLALAACGSGGTATQPSGRVRGQVLSAPSCPVQHDGHPCPPRPVVGGRVIAMRAGDVVASTHTKTGGRFQLSLDAGRYVIRATNSGGLATTAQKTVRVTAGAIAHVRLVVDSGIR